MKKIFFSIAFLISTGIVIAQDFEDVLRFGFNNQQGNARFSAMSGAFGALGANASAVSVNPAGSAFIRGNIFEFSPEFSLIKTENRFNNSYSRAFDTKFKIPNVSYFYGQNLDENDFYLTGLTYGFSINRLQLYNQKSNFTTHNKNNSLTDDFLALANQNAWFEDYNALAYNTTLIYFDTITNLYASPNRWFGADDDVYTIYGQNQYFNIKKSGYKREYLGNIGLDFSQKVFIGANVAAESIFYTEDITITEDDDLDNFYYVDNFTYKRSTEVSGGAVHVKIGAIAMPVKYLRLGVALHSPSIISLSSETTSSLDVDFQNLTFDYASSEYVSAFDYQMITPGKVVASMAYIFKNIAVIDVDFESVNYANGNLILGTADEVKRNTTLQENLTRANNIRIGGELKYGPVSFRVGYANYGNPYTNKLQTYTSIREDVSGGIGYAGEKLYLDFAWVRSNTKQSELFYYDYSGRPIAGLTNVKRDNIVTTIGFKF